ncbi:hypothetical protein Sango_2111500 [Sesamum angolense]|uniref:CCHC-type domain-containing protein n=1 Tax=Sesamum angolense TaxID=2727404 RepID=A0AAE2BM66_9LAMI|nr:hypothetical protein Sango_2111500 [Sesamum angolense]
MAFSMAKYGMELRLNLSLTEDEEAEVVIPNSDWNCKEDSRVFVHDLPLSQHTRAMAKYIGNIIGIFLDIELPENGLVWSSALKLRVSLDVSKPLKRALRLFSAQGIEKLVTLTYDRLPNFCYLCGCLGHIAKFCPKCYEDDFIDPGESLPYGP